jgi:polyhydroxyalkanoate synthesis regulator phasin
MAQNDLLKRYIDAGLEFTQLTQSRAEALVRDLVKAGEVQADQAREVVGDLLERSRKSSERLLETVRHEVREQITSLGLANKDDLDRIEERIASLVGAATAPAKKAATRAGATGRSTTKKAGAKKAPAKKASSTRKATAKKATATKATAKKATAATRSTKKAAAKTAPATRPSTTRGS